MTAAIASSVMAIWPASAATRSPAGPASPQATSSRGSVPDRAAPGTHDFGRLDAQVSISRFAFIQRQQLHRRAEARRQALLAGTPRQIALAMLGSYGWSSREFSCLDELWTRESGWNPVAENPSGAYGIPQALPGSKMASAGAAWATDPATQIRWGLGYIKELYSSPCGAWAHELAAGAY
ncbi:MAG: transglycosylase SLT domain-containing protein [Actinomycetota bacterium]